MTTQLLDSTTPFVATSHRGRMPRLAPLPLALAVAGTLLCVTSAQARITKIDVTAYESPTFGGYKWVGVGQYEKLAGKAFGEVDPLDPKNAVIVDIALAPRNARGMVEYSFDFYILKPIHLRRGAHKVMYEPPNRGGKTWNSMGRVSAGPGGTNDPGSIVDPDVLANSFLMPRGYTMVWSGWDKSAGSANSGGAQLQHHHHAADGEESRRLLDHRPGLRIHRHGQCDVSR